MNRFTVYQVDQSTYQVVDLLDQREICACSDYDEIEDAEKRAESIASLMNADATQYR